MRTVAVCVLFVAAIIAVAPPQAAAQTEPQIPAGYVELARERQGNKVIIYLGTPEDKVEYTKVNERLVQVNGAIGRIGAELKTEKDLLLPAFGEKYAEWLELDEEARTEMKASGVSLVAVGLISSLRSFSESGRKFTEDEINALWQEFQSSPLAEDRYQLFLKQLAKSTDSLRKWSGAEEFLAWSQHTHDVISFLTAIDREKYGKALVALLGLALHDPRAHFLVAEVEFLGAVVMAYATEDAARQEIDRILTTQTQHLSAVTHNCEKMKDLVDERKKLAARRAAILARSAASGQ
jgi:hypothetical protein